MHLGALARCCGPHSHIRLGAGRESDSIARSHAEMRALCDVDVCVFALQTTGTRR